MPEPTRILLRKQFEAETDIKMVPQPIDWKTYAEWLENLAIDELNKKAIEKNQLLRNVIHKTIDYLQDEILNI